MIVCGVDPGFKGGIAFYNGIDVTVYPMPVLTESYIKDGKKKTRAILDLKTIVNLFKEHKPDIFWLEKVSARAGQGVTSMFRFGQNYGEIRGVAASFGLDVNDVIPQTWKRVYGLTAEKSSSLDTAREFWPDQAKTSFKLKKHDGLAEASLIAKYGYDQLTK